MDCNTFNRLTALVNAYNESPFKYAVIINRGTEQHPSYQVKPCNSDDDEAFYAFFQDMKFIDPKVKPYYWNPSLDMPEIHFF